MGLFKKKMTGYTESTMINRQTGAGAYFKNYNVEEDTFSSAVQAGKLLGATQGGGTFTAKPTITPVEVDGIPSDAMGMEEVESWEVTMQATFIEIKPELIKKVLGAATQVNVAGGKYKKIQGKMNIDLEDYENNITFLGDMAGYDDPVIIQVYNALSTDGLSINPQDKKSSTISTTFKGHVSPTDYSVPPFAIFLPVKGATLEVTYGKGTENGSTKATVNVGGSSTLKYIIGTEETHIPDVGEALKEGTIYTTNSDIPVKEGDVIYMFELDSTNKVIQFNMHAVATSEIATV